MKVAAWLHLNTADVDIIGQHFKMYSIKYCLMGQMISLCTICEELGMNILQRYLC